MCSGNESNRNSTSTQGNCNGFQSKLYCNCSIWNFMHPTHRCVCVYMHIHFISLDHMLCDRASNCAHIEWLFVWQGESSQWAGSDVNGNMDGVGSDARFGW